MVAVPLEPVLEVLPLSVVPTTVVKPEGDELELEPLEEEDEDGFGADADEEGDEDEEDEVEFEAMASPMTMDDAEPDMSPYL
jgi:hypothetical protein